jgi:hypothetical protein
VSNISPQRKVSNNYDDQPLNYKKRSFSVQQKEPEAVQKMPQDSILAPKMRELNRSDQKEERKIKLNIGNSLDKSLISRSNYQNPKVNYPFLVTKMPADHSGSISYNELMLNKMYQQRRTEQEMLNKKSFTAFS